MNSQKQPGIRIGQVFLLAAQFKHRQDVLRLPPTENVGELTVEVGFQLLEGGEKSAGVAVRVRTNPEHHTNLYQFSVEMVALVEAIDGEENLPPLQYVMQVGSALLFPFIREAVANLTMRGRFGPVWIKPFNVQVAVSEAVGEAPASTENGELSDSSDA